jgi:roadblock/LC7 domain-containing protein
MAMFEGRMLDYEARWACQKRLMLNTRAYSFADRSGMNAVPQRGWTYLGEWTACSGDGGKRGVFVETSRADSNELFDVQGVEE